MGITAGFMVPHPPLIVQEIGRGEEKKIQKTTDAYREAARRAGEYKPDTIVVLSPHQIMYADYFHISPGRGAKGDFGNFRAKDTVFEVSYDTEFVEELCLLAKERNLPAGTMGERDKKLDHGTMVPLYFIDRFLKDYKIVRIGLSGLPLVKHYELGECIKEAAKRLNRKTVVVASGDLSHRLKEDGPYGYQVEGPRYDKRIMEVMGSGNFAELFEFSEKFCEKAGECGHRSFTIMAGTFDRTEVAAEQLSYEGPFGVGYGVCTYHARKTEESPSREENRNFLEQFEAREKERLRARQEKEDPYVKLARHTIETYLRTGKRPSVPEGLPEELYSRRAGAFVSLKEDGKLRGCIGTIQNSLAEESIRKAVSACSEDPRFPPVEQWEAGRLTISVDVLGDTERISSPGELDVERYGVIVTKGGRRGLLLPNLEGVDTVEQQIAIAKQKAGIQEQEAVELERFEVVRHY